MVIKKFKNRQTYEETGADGKRKAKLKNPWSNVYCKWKRPDYTISPKSNSREDILQYIVDTHLVEWYSTKLLKLNEDTDEAKEYIQEIWLQICEVKDDKWSDLYNQGEAAITAFVSGLVIRNCISNTSKAYQHTRGFKKQLCHFSDDVWNTFDEEGEWKLPYNYLQNDKDNDDSTLLQ